MPEQEYETVRAEVADRILTVTLNRPEKLNAFNPRMMSDLLDVLDAADADDDVRVIVVTGAGRGFCAGADVSSGGRRSTIAGRGPGTGTPAAGSRCGSSPAPSRSSRRSTAPRPASGPA